MDSNEQRVAEFKKEIADLRLRTPDDNNERSWLVAGLALPILGLVAIIVGWIGASGASSQMDQIPYLISGGVLGLGLIVVGSALFVRYSTTRYLRFWILRIVYEERTQTDRVVESLDRIETQLRSATRAPANIEG